MSESMTQSVPLKASPNTGETGSPELRGWQHRVAAGLQHSGLLRALQSVSRRCELHARNGSGLRLRRADKAKYLILGYHRIGTGGAPLFCNLPQAAFAQQMQYVRRYFRVISVRQMVEELASGGAHGQAVVVTFDDGYLGTFTEAFPVLRAYDIPATVYLTAGAIESGLVSWYDRIFLGFQKPVGRVSLQLQEPRTYELPSYNSRLNAATEVVTYLRSVPDGERRDWCRRFERQFPLDACELKGAMMDWEQVRAMKRAGVSFGAHTMSHPVTSRLTPQAVCNEIAESKWLIEEKLNTAVEDFAFPFGKPRDCAQDGKAILEGLGFQSALTTVAGVNSPGADPFALRRLVIGNDLSLAIFAFRLHRLFLYPDAEEALPVEMPAAQATAEGVL